MSNPADDQVLKELKTELVAFLFDHSGDRLSADHLPRVSDAIAGPIVEQVHTDLKAEMLGIRHSVEASLEEIAAAQGHGLSNIVASPWFLTIAAIALLSLGANVGLGIALLSKPVSKVTSPAAAGDTGSQPVDLMKGESSNTIEDPKKLKKTAETPSDSKAKMN